MREVKIELRSCPLLRGTGLPDSVNRRNPVGGSKAAGGNMAATTTHLGVATPTRSRELAASSDRDNNTQSVWETSDVTSAEHLRAILIHFEINAAVIQRDPLGMAFGIAELLVFAADHARAAAILESERSQSASSWHCFNCGEFVPSNFDICWNCQEACTD